MLIKYIRLNLKIISFLVLLLTLNTISADILFLKNGKVIIGSFTKEVGESIIFKNNKGVVKSYKLNEVSKLEIAYNGINSCYSEKANVKKKICGILFNRFEKNNIILITGKGDRQRLSINKSMVNELEISPQKNEFNNLNTTPKNSKMRVESKNKEQNITGKFKSINDDFLVIKNENGEESKIPLNKVKKIVYMFNEDNIASKVNKKKYKLILNPEKYTGYYFFPGIGQVANKRKGVGAIMILGTILSTVGILYEYNNQKLSVENAMQNKNNPEIVTEQRNKYNKSYDNEKYFIYGLVFLYTWNILDLIFRGSTYKEINSNISQTYNFNDSKLQFGLTTNKNSNDINTTFIGREVNSVKVNNSSLGWENFSIKLNYKETF